MTLSAPAPGLSAAEPELRWLAITWVNNAGASLVKTVPLTQLEAAERTGVGFSPVADAFGAAGGIDPAHRLAVPDGDLRLKPDASALTPLDPALGWAWAPGERWLRSGVAYGGDQRHFCRRQQEALWADGLDLRVGFELEWLLAEEAPDPDGAPRAAVAGGPYGADRLVEGLEYATAVLEAIEAADLDWLQFHPEYGASQFELSLAPGTALEAADRLVRARLVIQRVSRRFGWRCSFSPKPSLERVGNGCHLHLSLARAGVPLLQGGNGPAGLTGEGQAVLATLLQELPALMALSCPLAVSYQRLAPGTWSAPFQVWGVENREAALRLIPSEADGAAAHLELKVADAGANPYLLLGAVQLLAREALTSAPALPAPLIGDPAGLPPGTVPRLPTNLTQASAAFAASSVLRQGMGDALHGALLDSQAAEVRRNEALSDREQVLASCWWPLVGGPL
ncbi:glutamine synthetase family protein [Cyanobium sp. Morenito 9A2]|uniref:glutamine synthetase family protein n=1 Tax=Cyanobium sp. Morenito 9A2 TaxID=2823718 RepID=UPI0020CD993A|nr:glutamine synthetase family protein [Cyanobium sp. Morenito 9A2]MCP9851243.1 glutamine synthetase [Cyanobium sp. Morenito 9A2]